jgi:hypothetical protein
MYRLCLIPAIAALVLTGTISTTASAAAPERLVWSYEGGFFKDQGASGWVEKNTSGEYHFAEARRTREFIELRDNSRNCTVRLYRNAMFILVNSDFVKFYDGRWTQ